MAGLWEKDLPFCLLWVSKFGVGQRPQNTVQAAVGGGNMPLSSPPTWSWVSVDNQVISFQRWNPPTKADTQGRAETISTVTFPSTTDPRGMVAGGRLTLRGPVARLRLQQFLIKPAGQRTNSGGDGYEYSYMQYILAYDDETARPLFRGREEKDGEDDKEKEKEKVKEADNQDQTGKTNSTTWKPLPQEVPSPKTVGALQPDVPLDPPLSTIWFLNLTATITPATDTTPERRQHVSGIFLQPAAAATAVATATTSTSAVDHGCSAFPLF